MSETRPIGALPSRFASVVSRPSSPVRAMCVRLELESSSAGREWREDGVSYLGELAVKNKVNPPWMWSMDL